MTLRPGLAQGQRAGGKVRGWSPQPGSWSREKAPRYSLHTECSKQKVKDSLYLLEGKGNMSERKGRSLYLMPSLFCWPLQVLIVFQGLASVLSPPRSLSKCQATMLSCPALLKPLTTSALDVCMLLCLRVSSGSSAGS